MVAPHQFDNFSGRKYCVKNLIKSKPFDIENKKQK